MLQAAFPEDQHPPATADQLALLAPVSRGIAIQLVAPERLARGGGGGIKAAFVAVPETAMHKNDEPIFRQHEIRLAGKVLAVQAIAKSLCMKIAAYSKLGAGIPALYVGHHP